MRRQWGLEFAFLKNLFPCLNPSYGFFRELVKRGDAKFKMFFLGVLDFVVADALQALDEQHHGGNASRGDFGRIVQRATRQTMNLAAGFADGFVAQRDEFVVERARRDLPETFPRDFHVAFARKGFARSFCLRQHCRELGRIQMPLIQSDPTFFNHAGDDARFCGAGADGANAARPRLIFAARGDFINLGTHFCCREKCVLAAIHRRATGMRGLAVKRDRVPLDAKSSEHRAQRQIQIQQHRTLLDVQFQIRCKVRISS